jgi:hypothetical protein
MPRGQRPYLKRSKVPMWPSRGFSESVMGEGGGAKKPVKMFKPLATVSTAAPPKPATERAAYIERAVTEAETGAEEALKRKLAQQHRAHD